MPGSDAAGTHPPVILFLHGSGERGNDNLKQVGAGLGPYVRSHASDFPAIVVFPQVPEDGEWAGPNALVAFAALDAATREFHGDPHRTYLTGMSMGGYGTWELALDATAALRGAGAGLRRGEATGRRTRAVRHPGRGRSRPLRRHRKPPARHAGVDLPRREG